MASVFDCFSQQQRHYRTALGRFYLERKISALLDKHLREYLASQPSREMMVRKADMSELVRMFMKNVDSARLSINDSETLIRKMLL